MIIKERCLLRAYIDYVGHLCCMFKSSRYVWNKTLLYIVFDEVISGQKRYMALRRHEKRIFSRVIGRKLDGTLVSHLLRVNIVQAFFRSEEIEPEDHTA